MNFKIRKTIFGRYKVYYFGRWVATCKYVDDAFLLVDHDFDWDSVP